MLRQIVPAVMLTVLTAPRGRTLFVRKVLVVNLSCTRQLSPPADDRTRTDPSAHGSACS
jgi:hypothetical protein